MRHQFLCALLTLGLAASPALAASTGTTTNDNTNRNTGANLGASADRAPDQFKAPTSPGATEKQAENQAQNQNGSDAMESQTALAQSLRQAGFQDVQITARSYVVHAKGPDGAPVVMMITPDSVTGVVEHPQSAELPDLDQQNAPQNGANDQLNRLNAPQNGAGEQMPGGDNGTQKQD